MSVLGVRFSESVRLREIDENDFIDRLIDLKAGILADSPRWRWRRRKYACDDFSYKSSVDLVAAVDDDPDDLLSYMENTPCDQDLCVSLP
jgi:hypothetical protein